MPFTARLANRLLLAAGVLVIVLSALHLAATPLLMRHVLGTIRDKHAFGVVSGPFLLNHFLVTILLLAIGVTTIYASHWLDSGQRWPRVVALANAVAMAAMPLCIAVTVGRQHISSKPFAFGVVLACVVPAMYLLALLAIRASSREGSGV